jgi:AcrR family transcriptional regulator
MAATSARDRLLAAADELFYAEGIHTVGIDRVIERAGVAKASLYSAFGSKDELVRAYLLRRHERRQRRMTTTSPPTTGRGPSCSGSSTTSAESYRQPTFRGCPFVNANAESLPGGPAEEVTDLSRRLGTVAGARPRRGARGVRPGPLVDQLILLYDGATVSARLDRNRPPAEAARAVAAALLPAAP